MKNWRELWTIFGTGRRKAYPKPKRGKPKRVLTTLPTPDEARARADRLRRYDASVGGVSIRLGHDFRELRMMGYSIRQIDGVLRGGYTLNDLLRMEPEEKPKA